MVERSAVSDNRYAHFVVRSILLITYLVILQNFVHFVGMDAFLEIIILVLEWALFLGLLTYFFMFTSGYRVLKAFLVFAAAKILYYVIVEGVFSFQKGIILLILLVVFCVESESFRVQSTIAVRKHFLPLAILILLSVIPFYGWYNRYDEVMAETVSVDTHRYAGLWDLPHSLAYYVFALMNATKKTKGVVWLVGILLIIATGVRSAILAVAVYLIVRIALDEGIRRRLRGLVLPATLLLAILLVTPIGTFVQAQIEIHFAPLIEGNIEEGQYGAGRVGFAIILVDQLSHFNLVDFLIGRSATELYHAYSEVLGLQSWPHNDLLAVVYLYGIVGTAMYIWYVYYYPVATSPKGSARLTLGLIASIAVLALTNGFYTYRASYVFVLALAVVWRRPEADREFA